MSLQELAKKYMPGASLGILYLPENLRPVIVSGEGSRIVDQNGKSYIDYVLGSGPLLVGHAHPEVVQAVQEQAARSSTYYMLNEPAILLAEKIVEAVPCGESLRYQSGGSDATFNALRLARAATGRHLILKFEGGFHGWHDVAQHSVSFRAGSRPKAVTESAGIAAAIAGDIVVARFNDLASVEDIVADHTDAIAAIIVEPMQRAISPAPGFLEGLRDLATKHGIVLIFDEVVTGFRLAWGGAQERYGVTPDLACYGKAIGGGYPIAAIVGRTDLLSRADPRKKGTDAYCYLGGTFSGNPISASAGLAALNVLGREGSYERLDALGQRLRTGLEAAARREGVKLKAIGEGPVAQILFTDKDEFQMLDDFVGVNTDMYRRFAYEMISRGAMLLPAGKLYISLAHSEQDIDTTIEYAQDAIRSLVRA
jgi:glutamate-1-semialdehyde 2,1-aminomutase